MMFYQDALTQKTLTRQEINGKVTVGDPTAQPLECAANGCDNPATHQSLAGQFVCPEHDPDPIILVPTPLPCCIKCGQTACGGGCKAPELVDAAADASIAATALLSACIRGKDILKARRELRAALDKVEGMLHTGERQS